ncbi:MAG: TetR/AcrR family transcriptional regulator [Acidimicrobiia bacterium]
MVIADETRVRLNREAWITAALEIVASKGVEAVAVEPLAERLGVTKGSFYWHFRDRDELIAAALGHWAVERTAERMRELLSIPDPRHRLAYLLGSGELRVDPIDVQLVSSLSRPDVVSLLRDHHRTWLEFAENLYSQLCIPESEAKLRGLLAYGSYLGLVVLSATNPDDLHRVLGGVEGATIVDLLNFDGRGPCAHWNPTPPTLTGPDADPTPT